MSAMINKRRWLRASMGVVFALAIGASIVGGNQEANIIRQRNFVPGPSADKPVSIKGRNYYVSDDELFRYQSGRYGFFVGCLILFILIGVAKKFDPDPE